MKEQDAEARLARAMEDAAPNRLDELLEVREEARRQEKIVDISAPPKKKRRRWQNFAAAVAAALVLVIGGGSFFGWRYANAPDSLVDIDVNPSVQLTVSRNEKVLSCEALNADGAEIIDDMDLRGAQLNVAVNALIGSMVQHGYIDELKNSVLITVANEDAAKAQALQESLMADISGLLAGESVDAAVMGQTITTRDQTLASQAETYGISAGKAALIQRILDTDPTLTFESLAGLSVNDLNLLLQSKQADTSGMTVTGQASDKAYIGLEKAREDGGWINGGFMAAQPELFRYLTADEGCVLEREPMEALAAEGKLGVYKHEGFWQCMDTQRDKILLEERWERGGAPWKIWSD